MTDESERSRPVPDRRVIRTFRVFASSTFEDLKAERDALAAQRLGRHNIEAHEPVALDELWFQERVSMGNLKILYALQQAVHAGNGGCRQSAEKCIKGGAICPGACGNRNMHQNMRHKQKGRLSLVLRWPLNALFY